VIALQKRHTDELLRSHLGRQTEVLVEGVSKKDGRELVCRTEHDQMAVAPGDASLIGNFAFFMPESLSGNTLRGRFL
jgi:tRNA A37 methylthiotransferase MiaB